MTTGKEEREPDQECTAQANLNRKEQGGSHGEGAVQPPLSPLMQEQQGWYEQDLSDEQRVKRVKEFLRERHQQSRGAFSPEEIIRAKLEEEWQNRPFHDEIQNEKRSEFFFQVLKAWDALVYDRYAAGSAQESLAGVGLSHYYQQTRELGDASVIRLTPEQTHALDILTTAVGIPHPRGQTTIPIAEKHRNRNQWLLSPEYQERLARAKAAKSK